MLKTRARWRGSAPVAMASCRMRSTPDAFERDAARLVLVEVVGRDWSGEQGADARDQHVPVGGVRPGGTPVFEPGQQGVAGELAEALPVTGDGDAPAGQVDVVQVSSRDRRNTSAVARA